MAVKSKKGKTVDKWRKKKYFSVLAPKSFQERELGQAMAYESSSLEGRCIKFNLMMLTGNVRRQDVNITFKIDKVKGDTAFTMVDSYSVSPASIKRKIRRQRDRLDESFNCVTKDNKIVRIKPFIVTAMKTSQLVRAAARRKLVQFIHEYVGGIDYDTLILDVMNEKLQKEISKIGSKIVPIRFVAIRILKYVGEKEATGAEVAEAVEDTPEAVNA
ncbi:MAG: hypothetical protein V1729_04045 [Candidatus Woesearchaeota archaeon]